MKFASNKRKKTFGVNPNSLKPESADTEDSKVTHETLVGLVDSKNH